MDFCQFLFHANLFISFHEFTSLVGVLVVDGLFPFVRVLRTLCICNSLVLKSQFGQVNFCNLFTIYISICTQALPSITW